MSLLKHKLATAKSRGWDRRREAQPAGGTAGAGERGVVSSIDGVIATSEYELLTQSVGLVDRSERGKFLVRGGEAADFLQGQVSNDV